MGVRTLPLWCIGAVVAFAAVVRAPFVGDDLESLLFASRGPSWAWLTDLGARDQARPVTWLIYWVEHRAFGTVSAGYHLVGLVLHGCNAWLVSRVAKRLAGDRWPMLPLVAGLAFLLSPAHVEPVAWIAAQADLLVTAISLLAVLAWLRWRTEAGRWGWTTLALVAVALVTKEPAVALPLVLVALHLLLPPPAAPRRAWPWLVGAGALAVAHLVRIGSLDPSYADDQAGAILADGPLLLVRRGAQVAVRAVLPAMPPAAWAGVATVATVLVVVATLAARRGSAGLRWADASASAEVRTIAALGVAALAAVVPVARFGASLTSQAGERFAYLPSAFALPALVLVGIVAVDRHVSAARRWPGAVAGAVGAVAAGALLFGASVHGRAAAVGGELVEGQATWPLDESVLALGVPDQMEGVWVNRYGFAPALVLVHGWDDPPAYGEAAAYASGLEAPTVRVEPGGCAGCVTLVLEGDARWVHPTVEDDVQGFLGPGVDVRPIDARTVEVQIGAEARFDRFVVASRGRWVEVDQP